SPYRMRVARGRSCHSAAWQPYGHHAVGRGDGFHAARRCPALAPKVREEGRLSDRRTQVAPLAEPFVRDPRECVVDGVHALGHERLAVGFAHESLEAVTGEAVVVAWIEVL